MAAHVWDGLHSPNHPHHCEPAGDGRVSSLACEQGTTRRSQGYSTKDIPGRYVDRNHALKKEELFCRRTQHLRSCENAYIHLIRHSLSAAL